MRKIVILLIVFMMAGVSFLSGCQSGQGQFVGYWKSQPYLELTANNQIIKRSDAYLNFTEDGRITDFKVDGFPHFENMTYKASDGILIIYYDYNGTSIWEGEYKFTYKWQGSDTLIISYKYGFSVQDILLKKKWAFDV